MDSVTVKFKSFKWDKKGYLAVKNSAGVQNTLKSKAIGIQSRANASVAGGYELKSVVLPRVKDKGFVVRTKTKKAREHELNNNTLLHSMR